MERLNAKTSPDSMMAWLEVPKIASRLPIYHGTGNAALMAGVGHCDWSALPVGGIGNRCVLTAHSGMQDMRMFDDIRGLGIGDVFVIWTLNEPYAYRVCEIEVILPEEVDRLAAEEGRDLCTLFTCTPYGINSHRLLVTGERCGYEPSMSDDAGLPAWVNGRTIPLLIAIALLIALLLLLLLLLAWKRRKKDDDEEEDDEDGEDEESGESGSDEGVRERSLLGT